MVILVTGATGNVGRRLVDELRRADWPVRAMTRRPATAGLPAAVPVVAGDLAEPATLDAALAGVERLFLFPVPETADEVVARAKRAGVRRIVTLSSAAVTAGYDTEFHYPVEQAVESSGLAWTHVRPGEFALNKLYLWGPSIRQDSRVVDPYPDSVETPVHEADIADVAFTALTGDGHAGAAHSFVGPPASHREQVEAIAAAVGRAVTIARVTPERAREHYRRQGGWAAENADFLLGFADYSGNEAGGWSPGDPDPDAESEPDPGADSGPASDSGADDGQPWEGQDWAPPEMPTIDAIVGRPARTFAEWAKDHAEDFR